MEQAARCERIFVARTYFSPILLSFTPPAVASELAHRTAQALVGGFPEPDGARGMEPITREGVVAVVAAHGVDVVAELWADSPATTLPGALWRLFLVREWLRRDPALIARRYAVVVDLTGAGPEALARLEADRRAHV